MFNSEIGQKLAAVVCTVLFSALCVAGAVGPATGGGQAAAKVARQLA